jgi:transposase
MKYETMKGLSASQFRRAAGVKRETFNRMLELLEEAQIKKKARGGRPNKLSVPTMLVMTLEYLREYRTYLQIGTSYGVSESAAFQTIRWVENTLIKCKEFRLPGKKALLKTDHEFEIVLIDATESPIERPKKNSANFTQGRKSDIH